MRGDATPTDVEKHRKALVRDAEKATRTARDDCVAAIAEVERTRVEVVEAREAAVWASLFPHPSLQTVAPSHDLAGGGRSATERHLPVLKAALPAQAVLGLLREDADYVSTVATVEQAAAAAGVSESVLTGSDAVGANSDEHRARQRREREALVAAGGSPVVDALKHLEAQRHDLPPLGSG